MTAPSNAMESFQEELWRSGIKLPRGHLDPDLFIHADVLNGIPRFTYVRLDGRTVTAFVMFALVQPIEGKHCFALGYAVPEAYRNQGRAKGAVTAAIAELQHGLGRAGITPFYLEAIVGADNTPSRRVAEQVICDAPVAITDQISGLPAFQYIRKVEQPKGL